MPREELRGRLHELPRDVPIVVYCARGVRAYSAQRLLHGAGLKDVSYLEGSMTAWAGEVESDEAPS
ncbi:MAG: rhodanese-like domain-containing protein [Anaerolineae bacterium]